MSFISQTKVTNFTLCLKITEKVSFKITITLKMPKMVNLAFRSNSVIRQVNFIWTKIGDNAKIEKLKGDILSDFQTLWYSINRKKYCTFRKILYVPKNVVRFLGAL